MLDSEIGMNKQIQIKQNVSPTPEIKYQLNLFSFPCEEPEEEEFVRYRRPRDISRKVALGWSKSMDPEINGK